MSEAWATRQRRTNELVRLVAGHVLEHELTGEQLIGLCKLTWITNSFEGDNPAYIGSTKIPGLAQAIGRNFDGWSISSVADAVSREIRSQATRSLVTEHTGFTNFYKAFRNSAQPWAHENRRALTSIFRDAFTLETDDQGASLVSRIAELPQIPKANHPEQGMRPEFLLTPVCFALDPRLRFPIMNGAGHVLSMLRKVGVTDGTLTAKYRALVGLIGTGGIRDAADLDQLGAADQVDLLTSDRKKLRHLLQAKPEHGNELPLKDEQDIERLQATLSIAQRRLHNHMTNQLRYILARWTLLEGHDPDCRYDVLVKNYDNVENDLLIEVKSTADMAAVRMAIGQVYAYWHKLVGEKGVPHTAILLPSRPDVTIASLLHWLRIGLLWIENESLRTCSPWLESIAVLE